MNTKIYYIFKLKKYTSSVIRNHTCYCFKILQEIHDYSQNIRMINKKNEAI